MVVMFIWVLGIVIKCIDGNWCEPVNPKVLTDLMAMGATETLFEMGQLIKIYREKDRIRHNK